MRGMAAAFTPVIVVHTAAALGAVVLGAVMFAAPKGTTIHRVSGRSWVAVMLFVAISSFWIRSDGRFSWVHILSVVLPFLLAMGVWFAATHRVSAHRKTMIGVYLGALVITGAFTLLPERLLGRFVWGKLGLL